MKTTKIRVLSATAVVGLLSLTACSGGDNYAAFCEFSEDSQGHGEVLENIDLNEQIMSSALEGDFGPLNEWGETTAADLKSVEDAIAAALGDAPDAETEAALDQLIQGVGIVTSMADSAADASDLEQFVEDVQDLQSEFIELEASGNPDTILDAKAIEFC